MSKLRTLAAIDLGLFDGEAAAAAPAAVAAPQAENAPGNSRRAGTSGDAVAYGRQPQAPPPAAGETSADITVTTDDEGARKAAFETYIRENKDLYDARVQDIVRRRLGDVKQMETTLGAVTPIMEVLAQKYGVSATDPQAIAAAVERDDVYWEQAAEDAGMSVEQFRTFRQMERENEHFRAAMQKKEQDEAVSVTLQHWSQQAEKLAQTYPQFDLEAECANKSFMDLLQNNVEMRTAYEVVHMEDIKNGVASTTAKQVAENVTQNIRAKGMRPPENGAAAGGGVLVKSDVSKLTRADRAEIARRVSRGEKITF